MTMPHVEKGHLFKSVRIITL